MNIPSPMDVLRDVSKTRMIPGDYTFYVCPTCHFSFAVGNDGARFGIVFFPRGNFMFGVFRIWKA